MNVLPVNVLLDRKNGLRRQMASSANPPDETSSITDDDLAACLRVLHALAPDSTATEELQAPRLKPLRKALQPLIDDVRSRIFQGGSLNHAERKQADREAKKERHRREQRERALERNFADKTRMRAERLQTLEALEGSDATPRAPDGAVGLLDGVDQSLLTNLERHLLIGESDGVATSEGYETKSATGGGQVLLLRYTTRASARSAAFLAPIDASSLFILCSVCVEYTDTHPHIHTHLE